MENLDIDQDVMQFRDDWALALMEQGIIVKLRIKHWRAISRIEFEELGIMFNNAEHKEFMKKYIKLGHERLLPPAILNDIDLVERRARQCLASYSFNTLWGRFVPYHMFNKWKNKSNEIEELFSKLASDIGVNYDKIIKDVKSDYEKIGTEMWKQLYPDDPGEVSASFLENFTSRIIDKIPSREQIVASFKYEITYFEIPLPSFIQEDIAKADKIERDNQLQIVELEAEMQTKRIIAEEYREKKKALIDSFLESTITALRNRVAELADHICDVLRKHKRDINLGHVKQIKSLINHVGNLNFYDDKKIVKVLEELNVEVSKYKGERDKKYIEVKLAELVDIAKEEYVPEYNPIIDIIDVD